MFLDIEEIVTSCGEVDCGGAVFGVDIADADEGAVLHLGVVVLCEEWDEVVESGFIGKFWDQGCDVVEVCELVDEDWDSCSVC